jgi:hypothetical protein
VTSTSSSATPATTHGLDQAQAECAHTFQQIVEGVQANPYNSPEWVRDFIDPGRGVIDEQGKIVGGAPGPSVGSILCGLDFEDDDQPWIAAFATGYTTFDGSSDAPAAGPFPTGGAIPQPNVTIGSDGTLTPIRQPAQQHSVNPSAPRIVGELPGVTRPTDAVSPTPGSCPAILDLGTTGPQPAAGINVRVSRPVTCAVATQVAHDAVLNNGAALLALTGRWSCIEREGTTFVCTASGGRTLTFSLGPAPAQRTTTTSSQTSTTAVVGRAATAAQVAALTTAAQAGGELIAGYSLDDVTVTNNGWAEASLLASNPQDQGDGVLIFKQTAGVWKYVTGGSSNLQGVPAAVLNALFRAATSQGNR